MLLLFNVLGGTEVVPKFYVTPNRHFLVRYMGSYYTSDSLS